MFKLLVFYNRILYKVTPVWKETLGNYLTDGVNFIKIGRNLASKSLMKFYIETIIKIALPQTTFCGYKGYCNVTDAY